MHLENIYCACSNPGRVGGAEAFALKILHPETLALLAENLPFQLLFLFYQRPILHATQSQAVGLHPLNDSCVRVKCIHLFH